MNPTRRNPLFHPLIPAIALIAALPLLLISCTVGPNYQRPPQHMPTTYKSAATQDAPTPDLSIEWWRLFNDPQLNHLQIETLAANTDIATAMSRVYAARAAAGIAASEFYPIITLDPSIQRARTQSPVDHNSIGQGGGPHTGTTVLIPFDLNYEVDIWGRVRRQYESARATYRATADDYEVVRQTVQADVATDYFNLLSLDQQDKILVETVDSYRTQVDLTRKELKAGLVGKIDFAQADAQLESTLTQELDTRRQRADQEHALAILLGRPPSELTIVVHPLDLHPPSVPAGLPAELLRRRPDVAEAEQNLIAANAQVGVATAQFFPAINLTGLAGFESFDLAHSLDWEQRIWSIGANASLPLFTGGSLTSNLEQTKANYQALVSSYHGTVLGAIRDVEDSLTDLHMRADEASAQNAAVEASRQYLDLSQVQYKQGLISYLTVIDAERTLLTNELQDTQILNERLASTVLLIKALGGGWDPSAPATQPSPPTIFPPSGR